MYLIGQVNKTTDCLTVLGAIPFPTKEAAERRASDLAVGHTGHWFRVYRLHEVSAIMSKIETTMIARG